MNNPRNQERQSEFRTQVRMWLLILSRVGLPVLGILLVGIIVGIWRLQSFVRNELAPLAEQSLTNTINRPVQLGKVTNFSLTGVQFGASAIPATPTDPDQATVATVEANFNPWQLIFTRQLKLDVTLVNADVYIDQDQQGRWLNTTIAPPGKSGLIKTDLDHLRLRNARLVLLPQKKGGGVGLPVKFVGLSGAAQLLENNQLIKFDVTGQAQSGGNVAIQGGVRPKTLVADLYLRGQDLFAAEVTSLVKLPLSLPAGKVNGDLQVKLAPEQDPLIYGSADLQKVTLQIPRVPQLLTSTEGDVYFKGTEIRVDNVTTNYGKIPLVANGIIDTEAGLKLTARVKAVSLANAQTTLNLKLPVPVAGQVKADLQITGKPQNLILAGAVATIKTAQIDKIDFKRISSKFQFSPNAGLLTLRDIEGETFVGGEIAGAGRIALGKVPLLNLNFTAKNVGGDAIAQLYDTKPTFQIGKIAATAQVTGSTTNVRTFVKWQAPQATYPGSGETIITSDASGGKQRTVYFQNVALRVGGGIVRATGKYANQRWQTVITGDGIPLEPFVNKNQLQNISLNGAEFNGRLIVAGTSGPFQIASVQTQGAAVQIAGGAIAISRVQLQNQNFAAQLVANNVQLGRVLKKAPPALQGRLAGTFQIAGNTQNISLKTLRGTGIANLNVAGGTVTATNIQLGNGNYQAQLVANNLAVQKLTPNNTPPIRGNLNGEFKVGGSVESFQPQSIQASGNAKVTVAGGIITASNILVAGGRYQAQVQANNVPVQRLTKVPPQFQGNLTGQLKVAGSVTSFQPQSIQASGNAKLNVAGGTITASNIQLAGGRYQAQVQANNVPVQKLAAVPPQFQGNLTGQLQVAGSVTSFQPQSIQATGQGRLNIAGGTITAANIQLNNGRYQALVDAAGVELSRFNQRLRGKLGGKLQVAGALGSATLANVNASGQVQLSQGVPGLERPLTAAIAWNGEKLAINQLTAPGLNVTGDISANANKTIPEITSLNLNVQAQDYNLQQLPINLPNQVAVKGKVDFNGRVTGRLPLPNVAGQIALRNLVVQDIAFEPLLTGRIDSAQGRGLNLDLIGNRDRIAVNLDGNNRPQSFLVQWQDALAKGQFQGNNIALNVQNFPLQILNVSVPPALRLGTGKVAGLISGDLQLNQQSFTANGSIAIANPKLGRIQGDRLTAQFNYADGKATLTKSEFVKGESLYAFAGSFGQTARGPQLQGKLNVSQGKIQDVLAIAQIYNIQDLQRGTSEPTYGTAADLTTYSRGLPNQPLLDQLQRLYEIDVQLAQQQQQRRDTNLVPELADLQGTFNGELALDTATANGLSVEFNFNGKNFTWGKPAEDRFYRAKQIIAQGSFNNGVLQLRPLRVELDNSLLAFTGNIGGQEQSGQLRVTNFPLSLISNFVKLPVDITGNLNATAALAGGIVNPQAQGELQITDGTLNRKPVQSATASFNYNNGRLNFGSNVTVAGPEPVNIAGSIPYQLPFATTAPASNEIDLNINVKNEGLALLNLLTDQVSFENGQGEINLKVRGTRQRPELIGTATVQEATFSASALPEKIQKVTGKVQFDFDRILVENLQGNFSKGKVEASGEIPVFSNVQTANNPLAVNLNQLTLNLKGLYKGGVNGNLQIIGSALNPVITGQIGLYNGQVLLAESTNNNLPTETLVKVNKQNKIEPRNNPARLSNLELTLGNNIQIVRPPILSFQATGNLIVNGSLSQPVPDGTIRLKSGGVNLFTTQFNLVRGYKNTAVFKADQPRDPILDVQLFAKVVDSVQTSELTRSGTTGFRPLESVRVEAKVQGPASKLNENLELTSSPSRSQVEIVALLGGGFVDTQGRADSTLGLINIAGSAVFNNFQTTFNQIANSFGLSEFRIFPTVISDNPEAGRSTSTIELAAEAGVDISTKFSISSIKILTANDPFQWGINYRINDELRLRASTNFDDDNRAVIEYQTRF